MWALFWDHDNTDAVAFAINDDEEKGEMT